MKEDNNFLEELSVTFHATEVDEIYNVIKTIKKLTTL